MTLIQTEKIEQFPVVVFGSEYHHHILEHVRMMVGQKTISLKDPDLFLVTDSIDEAVEFIRSKTDGNFGLRLRPRILLGEKAM